MSALIVLIVIGAGTYGMRSALLLRPAVLPEAAQRLLPSVAPSVIAAIAAPGLLSVGAATSVGSCTAAVLAAVATVLLWRNRRTFGVPLAGGMTVWWIATAALSLM
jgi:branched-subunit amino acid transport protein